MTTSRELIECAQLWYRAHHPRADDEAYTLIRTVLAASGDIILR